MTQPDAAQLTEQHPRGLYVLFATEMWERFGFYSMLAMFTLYLKDDKQGFGWSAEDATKLYANYLMFVYASPLIGGWIADKKLGYRNSVLLGGVIFMVGYFLLSIHSIAAVYAALTCLVVGNGFFKPNVSAMVGHLYPEGSVLKDRAYNIFYMGINIGALMAPINAEIWVHQIGFNKAFAIASLGMILSIGILWVFRQYVERGDQLAAATSEAATRRHPIDSVPDATRIGALIVVFLIVIVFWMVFHQNGSTLTYWADDNTDWNVSGVISNAINPFWVVTLTFPVVWLWGWLNRRGQEPSTPAKMTAGMFLTTASFSILYFAAKTGEAIEVRPEMYRTGSFQVTDRVVQVLERDGVNEEVLRQIDQAKDSEDKPRVKGRKFKSDKTLAQALATVKQELKSDGLDEGHWTRVKDAEIKADGPLNGGTQFADALSDMVEKLKAEGLPDAVASRMLAYRDKTFAGEEKLTDALTKAIGPDYTARYRDLFLQRAYLFRVSPLWLIVAYAVVTLAELMLSPMGLSLVSKVAPVHLRGVMMGGWFVATAIGNKLTMIGVFWDQWLHSTFFAVLGAMALVMGLVLLGLLKPLKRAMPGV